MNNGENKDLLWCEYSDLPSPLSYKNKMVYFEDAKDFTPCYTPVEMFRMGIFGGSYFQIQTDLPSDFIDELGEIEYGNKEDKNKNFYGVVSGSSLEWWKNQGLIHKDDPNGWVEWYVKFYYGRRHPDDSRQIQRFKSFISRHMGMIRSYETKGKDSPKTKQNLLQWAWDYTIDLKN
jgi:hypothetical protein